MKDTGFKQLKRTAEKYFENWGRWMKRAGIAERKVEKLKRLLLLTDPSVSNITMNDTAIKQWQSFIAEFPDEGSK